MDSPARAAKPAGEPPPQTPSDFIQSFRHFCLSPASQRKMWGAQLLAIPVLILFGGFLFTNDSLVSIPNGDLANQFYAWRDFGFSELRKGHLALWNPYTYAGAPYFAGFQSALLYPLNWIFLFLPLVPALNLSIALHVFLAGFFTYLWLAKNRLAFLPAFLGAFVFMFGGAFFLHVYPGHLPNLCTMAWIPLVFLSVEEVMENPSWGHLLKGSAVLALQLLAGHIQYFTYTLFVAGLYALFLAWLSSGARMKKLSLAFLMVVCAWGLTAVQWLPGLEASGESLREAPATLEAQKFFSLNPLNLVTVVASGLNGNNEHFSCWTGDRIWWESNLFIGAVPFLLALYGLFRDFSPRKWLWGGLALFCLLLAMGFYGPLYPLLYHAIPIFQSFRGSFKFVIFIQLAFSFLAAQGLQTWLAEKYSPRWPAWTALVLCLLSLGVAIWAVQSSGLRQAADIFGGYTARPLPFDSPMFGTQAKAVGAVSLGSASLFLALLGVGWFLERFGPGVKFTLAGLAFLQLGVFAASCLPSFNAGLLRTQDDFLKDTLLPHLGDGRVNWSAHDDRSLSVRMPDVWGDDPSRPKRYSAFLRYKDASVPEATAPTIYNREVYEPLYLTAAKMRLIRLAYLLESRGDHVSVTPAPVKPLPRGFLVGGWKKVGGGEEALQTLSQPGFDPQTTVLLEETPDPLPEPSKQSGAVSLRDLTTDRVEVWVKTEKPQVLLITDNYSRDWKALPYPDSSQQAYQMLPGDVFARAIPLSAGTHHFEMRYEPLAFGFGNWISLCSLLLYLLAWAGWAFQRAKRGPDEP